MSFLSGLVNTGRKAASIAAPIVGGALGGPAGAAIGSAVGRKVAPHPPKDTGGSVGPVGVQSHVNMPPMGATASSLGEARSQDKMRMSRQYGL